MRKINYLMIAAMFGISAMVFTGCSKDEEENTNASELKLVGTWTFDDTDVEAEIDGQDAEAWLLAHDFSEEDAAAYAFYMQQEMSDDFLPEGATFEFKDDKTFIVGIPGNDIEEGTWEFNADKTEIIFKGVGEQSSNGRISASNNDGEGQEGITFGVASMTKTLLVLTNTIEYDEDFDEDETDEILKITMKYEFVK